MPERDTKGMGTAIKRQRLLLFCGVVSAVGYWRA